MQDKSEINYWLGEGNIKLLTTKAIKVPDEGEVLSLDTRIDKIWMKSRFRDLSAAQLKAMTRSDDEQVRGDFKVISVKRWIRIKQFPVEASKLFSLDTLGSNVTSPVSPEIPMEVVYENFEVFLEAVKGS